MPATCMVPQVCSTECTATRRRDYMQLCAKCFSGTRPVQGDSMCSATVPSGLPSCICLCYDSVCTIVVYCTGAGCYICISVYMLQVLQNWRLCYLYILYCHNDCSHAYVCFSVCSNLNLNTAHHKSVRMTLQHSNKVLSRHVMPVLISHNEGVFDCCFSPSYTG